MAASRWRLALGVAVAALWSGAAFAQEPGEEISISVQVPEAVALGDVVRVVATVADGEGRPLPGLPVLFSTVVEFAGTVGEMELGQGVTDEAGLATLDHQVRIEGENRFVVRFFGDDARRRAAGSAVAMVTGDVQFVQRSAGVRVPFFGAWALIGAVAAVWLVYLWAMVLVAQMPDAGRSEG